MRLQDCFYIANLPLVWGVEEDPQEGSAGLPDLLGQPLQALLLLLNRPKQENKGATTRPHQLPISQNSFAEIARLLSEFFRDLDVVPTDVLVK